MIEDSSSFLAQAEQILRESGKESLLGIPLLRCYEIRTPAQHTTHEAQLRFLLEEIASGTVSVRTLVEEREADLLDNAIFAAHFGSFLRDAMASASDPNYEPPEFEDPDFSIVERPQIDPTYVLDQLRAELEALTIVIKLFQSRQTAIHEIIALLFKIKAGTSEKPLLQGD